MSLFVLINILSGDSYTDRLRLDKSLVGKFNKSTFRVTFKFILNAFREYSPRPTVKQTSAKSWTLLLAVDCVEFISIYRLVVALMRVLSFVSVPI